MYSWLYTASCDRKCQQLRLANIRTRSGRHAGDRRGSSPNGRGQLHRLVNCSDVDDRGKRDLKLHWRRTSASPKIRVRLIERRRY